MANTAVFGIYAKANAAELAVRDMKEAGFRLEDISILLPENTGSKDLAFEKGSKAAEGTAAGATSGAVIGGAIGWLLGIGALAVPGLGPFIAAGPLMAALAGLGVGGTVGGLAGALAGLGIPEYEAKRYEGLVRAGGILLSVHSDNADWTKLAKKILRETGASDISATAESKGDYGNLDKPRTIGAATDTGAALSNTIGEFQMATQNHHITVEELFVDALKDIYSAESQLIKALPKMVKAAESQELKQAFQDHLGETENQLERVKQAFEVAGGKAKSELCKGMQGIVAEGEEQIHKKTGDLGLIGAGERVEHYEMAAYQTAISFAKQLGLNRAEDLLSASLQEEEHAAKLLSQISQKMLTEMGAGTSASAAGH